MEKVIYENHAGKLTVELNSVAVKFKQYQGNEVSSTIEMFVEEFRELNNWITENRVEGLDD